MEDSGTIEQGTLGWGDGDEDVADIVEDESDPGLPLFRVTIAHGKGPDADANGTGAQGEQVLCRWGIILDYVPPKGAQCIVAFPTGTRRIPGAGVIIAVIRKNASQFKKERAVLSLGADMHLLVKARSTTIASYATPAQYIMVGKPRGADVAPRILIQDETGSGVTVQGGVVALMGNDSGAPKALLQVSKAGKASCFLSGGEKWEMTSGRFYTYGASNIVQGGGVFLGKLPTPANPALWGFVGAMGTPSMSVFISPA